MHERTTLADAQHAAGGRRSALDELPALARLVVDRAVPTPGSPARIVRVTQTGEMFRRPGARAMRFTATEDLLVAEIGYSWHATVRLGPSLTLTVRDELRDGQGRMRVSLAGMPFLRRGGAQIAAGSVLRYLAELPWVPHAIAMNRDLRWRQLDDHLLTVSTTVTGTPLEVRLHLSECGDVQQVFAGARPRDGDAPRPWRGIFDDYRVFHGVRIPTVAEAFWELPEGAFSYWRGRVIGLEVLR